MSCHTKAVGNQAIQPPSRQDRQGSRGNHAILGVLGALAVQFLFVNQFNTIPMNESRTFRDEGLGGPSRPPLGEDLLPPVEQPSVKFIMQLFVVPLLIVMAMVGMYYAFTTLFRGTTVGADKLIEGIEHGPSVARWQRASELADRLQNKGYSDLKRDRARAAQLAQILNREIERAKEGNDKQEDATLRYFLARAL